MENENTSLPMMISLSLPWFTFHMGTVVKGFREALLLMKEGAKWEIVCPPGMCPWTRWLPNPRHALGFCSSHYNDIGLSALGYGHKKKGRLIPAFSTLVFELTLIKVNASWRWSTARMYYPSLHHPPYERPLLPSLTDQAGSGRLGEEWCCCPSWRQTFWRVGTPLRHPFVALLILCKQICSSLSAIYITDINV